MVVAAKIGGSRGNSTVYCMQELRGYCTAFDGWLKPMKKSYLSKRLKQK